MSIRFLLCCVLAATSATACATGGGYDDDARLPVREAIEEAYEELPGVVLSDRHYALEGELRVTIAAPDSATARAAIEVGFAAADSVERLLSVHHAASEVSAINEAAGHEPVAVSPWTETVVVASLDLAERTGGAFDPTIGPLVEVWGFGCDQCARPDSAGVRRALAKVGWRKIRYDPASHTVFLPEAGMALDLRAAAKGFALDRMREAMLGAGATAGIFDLDGDHLFFGEGTESPRNLWPVVLSDPYDPRESFAELEVPAGAMSTTSPYSRTVEMGGERIGHLIDPRTGWPAGGLASVTVFATDAIRSDVLSTALFVLGRERGCDLLDEWEDVGAIFVIEPPLGQRGLVCVTPPMREYVKDLDPPYRPLEREDD